MNLPHEELTPAEFETFLDEQEAHPVPRPKKLDILKIKKLAKAVRDDDEAKPQASKTIDEILAQAGVQRGIHRVLSDPQTTNRIASVDTFTEATQAIETRITEAYKKGYIDGGINQITKEDK